MTDLVKHEPVSAFELLPAARELAEAISKTEFVPTSLRNRPEAVMAAVLAGHELGLPPMTALSKVHVIEGRPSLSADAMRALVLNAGHELWAIDTSNAKVTLAGRRKGSDQITQVTWTMDDAKRAGLERRNNWRAYPRAMLLARATGELCRLIFADVLAGIAYTSEEVGDGFSLEDDLTADAGEQEGAAPARNTRKASDARKRSKAAAAKAPTPPAPPLPGELDDSEVIDAEVVSDQPADVIDAEVVDEQPSSSSDADEAGRSGGRYTPAQVLAIRANEVGLSDDQRHGLYLAITSGRVSSGNDLQRDELDAAFEALDQIAAGTLELMGEAGAHWQLEVVGSGVAVFSSDADAADAGDAGDAGSGSDQPSEAALPADEAGWRSMLRARKVKLADLLRHAQSLTSGESISLADVASRPELGQQLLAWLEQEGGA